MCLVALKCAEMCFPLCWISCIVNGWVLTVLTGVLTGLCPFEDNFVLSFTWTFFEENFVHEHFLSAIFYMFSNCALLLSAHSCVCVCVCVCVCAISSWHRHRRYVSLCQFVRPTLPCTGDVSICNDVSFQIPKRWWNFFVADAVSLFDVVHLIYKISKVQILISLHSSRTLLR